MKKKIFIFCVLALLISYFSKILARRKQNIIPINICFVRPNGSPVNVRTVFKKPGQECPWFPLFIERLIFKC